MAGFIEQTGTQVVEKQKNSILLSSWISRNTLGKYAPITLHIVERSFPAYKMALSGKRYIITENGYIVIAMPIMNVLIVISLVNKLI